MSAALTLISANEVVNGGIVRPVPLNSRFDSQLLAPNIPTAEERFLIKNCLCRAFYEDLIAQKTTDQSNYNPKIGTGVVPKFGTNANYETLWKNYLQEVTARAVYFMSLDDVVLQTGSNGLFSNASMYAQNGGLAGLKYKKDGELEKINLAINRMKRYLCENSDLFPLWPDDKFCKDCGCSCDDSCDCTSKQVKDKDPNLLGGIIIY
jgi:hypothetical protein